MYMVMDVPKRAGIRIHSGNVAGMRNRKLITHFHGCIGLGMSYGRVYGQPGILNSVTAVRLFEKMLDKEPFILNVVGEFESYGIDY